MKLKCYWYIFIVWIISAFGYWAIDYRTVPVSMVTWLILMIIMQVDKNKG